MAKNSTYGSHIYLWAGVNTVPEVVIIKECNQDKRLVVSSVIRKFIKLPLGSNVPKAKNSFVASLVKQNGGILNMLVRSI